MNNFRYKSIICILVSMLCIISSFNIGFGYEMDVVSDSIEFIIGNASFEETNAAGQPYKWQKFNSASSFYITTKSEEVWDGKNAIVITDSSNTRNCGVLSEMIAIKPDTTYIMTGMAKELTEGTMFSYDLLFYDENKVSCGKRNLKNIFQ